MGVLKHFPSGDKYKRRILKSKLQPRKEVVSFRSRMDNNLNGKSIGPQTGVLTYFPSGDIIRRKALHRSCFSKSFFVFLMTINGKRK